MDGKFKEWWWLPVLALVWIGTQARLHWRRVVLAVLVVILLFLLTGCAHQERLVEVKIMVPVACKEEKPERPVMHTEGLAVGTPVDVQARHMRAEIDRREAYEIKLVAALDNCRAPIQIQ